MAVDDKKKYAYNYLIGKGLSPIAAAGIVGNLVAESGLNTTIPGRADDKGSIGIAQWHSDRKQGLMTFANKVNKPFSSLSTQLDYLVYELKSPAYSKALAGLNFAKTPGEASIAFMNHYEKPAEWAKKQSVGKRVGEATSIYTGKPYEGVNYSEDSEETFRDPNLDFDYNRNPTGATYTEEELEEAEAETAKQELLQKQKEKDFIAEVQSKEYAPQQQQDIPQEQAPQIDASLYEMPQIALPEYGNTQLPTMQFGGFAEVGKIIKDFEKAKAANKDRNKFLIKDTRKISATTGKPLNPNSDIVTGKYDKSVIRNLALAASKHYADPYTSVAVGLQESKLGTTDDNIGHIIGKHDTKFTGSEEEDLVRVLQDKLKYAKDLGIEDEATMIQAYNGLGKIFPQTEKRYHGFEMKKIYGVPVPKSGIDMKKTPLYGKRVIDLRDNVIKKNPEVVRYIENLPKYNHFSGKYEEKFNPLPMLNYEEGGETGGKITCSNCGWSWDKSESSQEDMYNCHKCGGTHGEESKYQDGGLIPGTPEYEKAYNNYNVFNYDKNSDTYIGRELNPVVVQGKPKQKGFWNEYFDNVAREHAQDGVLGAIVGTTVDAVAGLPQKAMTYAFTNKVQTPSQAMNIQNPAGAFAVDAVTDPMNLVGAGLLTKEKALGRLSVAPEARSGLVSNGFNNRLTNSNLYYKLQDNLRIVKEVIQDPSILKPIFTEIPKQTREVYHTFLDRNKPLYKIGADNLDNSLNNKVAELQTEEGFSRLLNQEMEITKELNPYDRLTKLQEKAKLNAKARIEELKQTENVNKSYINAKKENPNINVNPQLDFDIPRNNAYFTGNFSNEGAINLQKIDLSKINKGYILDDGAIKPGKIAIGKEFAESIPVYDHEINHALQNGRQTKIDREVIDFFKDSENVRPNLKSVRRSEDKNEAALNYLLNGSKGKEPSSFLAELRSAMKERGLIKNTYDEITPEILEKAKSVFTKKPYLNKYNGSSSTRILDIANPNTKTYNFLSQQLNKLPAVVPAAFGLGAASQIENKKYGGYYPKFN